MSTTTHHFTSRERAEGFVSGVEHVNDSALSVRSPGAFECPYDSACADVRLEDDDTGDFDIHGDLGYGLGGEYALANAAIGADLAR